MTSVLNFTAAHICLIALEGFAQVFLFFTCGFPQPKRWYMNDHRAMAMSMAQNKHNGVAAPLILSAVQVPEQLPRGVYFSTFFFSFVKLYT